MLATLLRPRSGAMYLIGSIFTFEGAMKAFAGINRSRLALSAAVIGAFAYPVWSQSWERIPYAMGEFNRARLIDAEINILARRGINRDEFLNKRFDICLELNRKGETYYTNDDGSISNFNLVRCGHPFWNQGPEASIGSFYVGTEAAAKALTPWIVDSLIGAALAAFLSWLLPLIGLRYARWLRGGNSPVTGQ